MSSILPRSFFRHALIAALWTVLFNASAPAQGPDYNCTEIAAPAISSREPPVAAVVDPPTPVVTLRMRAPAVSGSTQELEYRITIENTSDAPAHHVLVRDPLPTNARLVRAEPEPAVRNAPELIWQLGTLPACTKKEIKLVLAPTGSDDVQNCARVQFEHGQCVTTRLRRPALALVKNGPTEAHLNDSLSYRLTLTNTGDEGLKNVLLTDVLPSGLVHSTGRPRLSWIVGNLNPGQTQTIDYQVTARILGKLCNKVIATAEGNFRQEMESCVNVAEGRLEMNMEAPRRQYVNAPVTYKINVSNSGTAPLTNLLVTTPLPPGTTLLNANEHGVTQDSKVQWALGTLAAGAGAVLEMGLKGAQPGTVCVRASATAEHGASKQAEACTNLTGLPAVDLYVEDKNDPVEVGENTTYLIVVRNAGSSPATNVRIEAIIPPQMELAGAIGPSTHRTRGERVFFDPITIPVGAERRYVVDVKARRPGDVRFRVALTADQLPGGAVLQEESTTIYARLARSLPARQPRDWQRLASYLSWISPSL